MFPIVVVAKSNSSRVPRKNFRDFFQGKSLVDITLDLAFSCQSTQQVILSTDEANYSCSHPITFHHRKTSLAHKDTPVIDVLVDLINSYNLHSSKYIILLQPTSPFRTPVHLSEFISLVHTSLEKYPTSPLTLFSVYKVEDAHPARMYSILDHKLRPLDPSMADLQCQFLPDIYHRNGAFYCFSIDAILSGKLYTDIQLPYIMSCESSINIDTPLDFDYAKFLASASENK